MIKNKKNIILVDYDIPSDWKFHRGLEDTTNEKWCIYKSVSNLNHGGSFQKLIRYIKYFVTPLIILIHRKEYKKILAWQQFYGLILAFYCRLLHLKSMPDIVVMTFIYNPKKAFVGKLYDRFIRFIVRSGYVTKFVVFSESEKKRYSLIFDIPESMFFSVTLGCEDMTKKIPRQTSQEYFLSAGRSNRDYQFLIDIWKDKRYSLKIINDTLNGIDTESVKYMTSCHGIHFFQELAKAFAIIVPLENEHISSGQLVMIQAMMYGKPVIVTKNNTIRDYVIDEVTGLIIDKTEEALNIAVERLQDKNFYNYLASNGRNYYEKNFSEYSMGCKIGVMIK